MKHLFLFSLLISSLNVQSQVTANLQLIHNQADCTLELMIIYKNESSKDIQLDNKGQILIEKFSSKTGKYNKLIRPNHMYDAFDSHPVFTFWEVRNLENLNFSKDSLSIINFVNVKYPALNDSLTLELSKKIFLDINRPLILKPNETMAIRDNISIYLVENGNYRIKLIYNHYNYNYLFSNQFINDINVNNLICFTPLYNPKKNNIKTKVLCLNNIYINIE